MAYTLSHLSRWVLRIHVHIFEDIESTLYSTMKRFVLDKRIKDRDK